MFAAWTTTVEAHLQVGHTAATRTSRRRWIVDRYFGKFNKFRNDRWVFGDRDSGAYLVKFSWTDIVRHILVKGGASPDDPALADYWAERRRKVKPPLDSYTLRLLTRQDGALPALRGPPADRRSATPVPARVGTVVAAGHPEGDSRRLPRPPRATRPDRTMTTTRLVHASCHRGLHARRRRSPALQPAPPSRLA